MYSIKKIEIDRNHKLKSINKRPKRANRDVDVPRDCREAHC